MSRSKTALDDALAAADVFVVGGGVIGLAIAAELLERDLRVTVIERGRIGCGASAAAGGMLAPVSEAELEPDAVVALGLDSLARYPAWIARLEAQSGARAGYRSEGTLHVALDADDRAELERLARRLEDRGLAAVPVSGARARELEPHLSPRVTAGLVVAGDHQTDPRRLCSCLAQAIRRAAGGRVCEGVAVDRIDAEAGRVRGLSVRDASGGTRDIEAQQVVVAAGVDARRSLDLPIDVPGLRPVKGQLLRLRGTPLIERVVRSPEAYLIPRGDGELLVGATMEEMGFDERATAGAVLDLLRHGWEVLPGIYDLEFAEVSVGLRSAVSDHVPVIGPTAVDGLYLAVGHFRNGILLAPATAFYLARAIAERKVPEALGPFEPRRLDRAAGGRPRSVE